jgi:prepilin-type processing-associated H-X9-DG protein
MNGFIEGGYYKSPTTSSTWFPNWYCFNKISDIVNPPPVKLWVFVDEHPDSINDGWLITHVEDLNNWIDLPASYHNGACGFGFADGHAEIKKWRDSSTVVRVKQYQYNGFPAKNSLDIPWVIERTSARSKI